MSMFKMLAYAVMCFSASHALSQDYEIRLTRPARAGAKFEIAAIASQSSHRSLSQEGQILKEDSSAITVTFEGAVTILQVSPSKHASKIRVTVSECTVLRNDDGREREALPQGAQIIVQLANGKTEFLIDGQRASKDMTGILSLLFTLHTTKTDDDDIFGTKERKRVGDVWALDSAKASASLSAEFGIINAENIHGETTLEKIVDIDRVPCLRIGAKMEAAGFIPPLPPGVTVETSKMSAAFSGDFPIDVSLDCMHDEMSLTVAVQAKGKPDPQTPEVTISMTMEQSRSASVTPLQK